MRLVVDTNVLISGLLSINSSSATLIDLWLGGAYHLVSATNQIDEIARVTRYPKIRDRLRPGIAGRLVNDVRRLATMVENAPVMPVCRDPNDDYLLAIAKAGSADCLVTGDKHHLLTMRRYGGTRIVTVREAILILR